MTLIVLTLFGATSLPARPMKITALPDPYYPQKPTGELRLNYYYDRTGRWVKFSDWIPFRQRKWEPRFFEDFYRLYGLPPGYNAPQIKESMFYLYQSLSHRFRHPSNALCAIKTEEEHHRYRNLMYMHTNLLIMRMYLRLGSMYDKRHLYYQDLDAADDLEVSFLIARTYYNEARLYWEKAREYADEADQHKFELNLPAIETERFQIRSGKLNFDRIIALHVDRVESKLALTQEFLDEEGRPRPVKLKMLEDVEKMYDEKFPPDPLDKPQLNPHWSEKDLFPD